MVTIATAAAMSTEVVSAAMGTKVVGVGIMTTATAAAIGTKVAGVGIMTTATAAAKKSTEAGGRAGPWMCATSVGRLAMSQSRDWARTHYYLAGFLQTSERTRLSHSAKLKKQRLVLGSKLGGIRRASTQQAHLFAQ